MLRDRDVIGVPSGATVSRPGRVAEVGVLAHETLQHAGEGRIAAAFERSFYAVFGGRWVCIGSRDIGSGPLHVLCDPWPSAAFVVGQTVTIAANVICVDDAPLVNTARAPVWRPKPAPAWTPAQLQAGLEFAGQFWSTMPVDEGLAALGLTQVPETTSPLLATARPGVQALERIAAGERAPADDAALADLIGLGPGLTPSGDDVLIGALLALTSLGRDDTRDALWAACISALDRTGDISRAHLEAAARGYGAAVLHDAIHVIASGNTENIAPALVAVSAIGHTSGRDGMTGALIALRAVARALMPEK